MTEIDDRLRDYLSSLKLDSIDVQGIAQSSEGKTGMGVVFPSWRLGGFSWVAAALLLVTISVGIHEYSTHSERKYRTLNEAAMNHSTRLQLEFEGSTIVEFDQSMSQLPFMTQPMVRHTKFQALCATIEPVARLG